MTPRIKDAPLKGKIHQWLYFDTLTYQAFNYYYDLFYKNNIKIVPKNIGELLTAKSLAY
jgi:predicted 3-demethylubiquinone-9 3-methyltransferase (glyoxalase superfamily)